MGGYPFVYSFQIAFAATTKPSVRAAISTSPNAPTMKGRTPCFDISRKLVRVPQMKNPPAKTFWRVGRYF